MRPLLIYIIEFFLCSGLFLLLYRSLVVRKVSYGFCRRYLIIAMLLSATIPMLNVPLYPPQTIYLNIPVMTSNDAEPTEEEIAAGNPSNVESSVTGVAPKAAAQAQAATPRLTPEQKWKLFFLVVYGIGLLMSLILIVRGIGVVIRLKRKSEITVTPAYDLAVSDRIETPFSFMRTVFIGRDYDDLSRKHILSHESSHVRHRHSLEKLAISTLRSVFWFNPFMWIAEKRLEEVQEWQADHDALADGYNISEYRLSIIRQLFGCNPEMTSGLNSSLTKLRFLQMKQPEIKGGAIIQTVSTMLLAAVLFLGFGCTASGIKPTGSSNTAPPDRIIVSVDRFFDDTEGVKTRNHKIVEKYDMFNKVSSGIEIYENYDNPKCPVTIAVNGILLANTPTDACLKWVKESTPIFIGGKKSTLAEFRALKEGDYEKIFFYKPQSRSSREKFGFVFATTERFQEHEYNYTVAVDRPDLEVRNIVSPFGMGFFPDVFVYQTDKYNVATPDAKFVIDGEFVDYQEFRSLFMEGSKKNYSIKIFRNEAARKAFGTDVWEVAEINSTRQGMSLGYHKFSDGRIVPTFEYHGNVEVTYDEIRSRLESIKAINKANGNITFVSFRVDSYVPDSLYQDLIDKCIDTDDPDIFLDLVRYREIRAKDNSGNVYIRNVAD